jgi:hypothetical protein
VKAAVAKWAPNTNAKESMTIRFSFLHVLVSIFLEGDKSFVEAKYPPPCSRRSLETLRGPFSPANGLLTAALLLIGAALQSAKVINGDRAIEWFASSDLVRRLNGARF